MIRGYAIGIGAGTQVFTALAWFIVTGGANADPTTTVGLMTAGWVINLAIAELGIRNGAAIANGGVGRPRSNDRRSGVSSR